VRVETVHERWEGFWCLADDRYYARGANADGTEQWYRFAADDRARESIERDARVLALRRSGLIRRTRRMLLLYSANGRSMLVGTSGPRSPRRVR
jgi:hypothetical protein